MLNEVNDSIKQTDTIKDSEGNEQAGKTSKRKNPRSKRSVLKIGNLGPMSASSSETVYIDSITSRSKISSNRTNRLTMRKKSTISNSAAAAVALVAAK